MQKGVSYNRVLAVAFLNSCQNFVLFGTPNLAPYMIKILKYTKSSVLIYSQIYDWPDMCYRSAMLDLSQGAHLSLVM